MVRLDVRRVSSKASSVSSPGPRVGRSTVWDNHVESMGTRSSNRMSPFDLVSESQVSTTKSLAAEEPYESERSCIGKLVSRMVQTQAFNNVSGAAIIANSVVLGASANYTALAAFRGDPPDDVPLFYQISNIFFTVWFTFELLLRFLLSGGLKTFFCKDDWSWNLFDSVVVGSDLIYSILELTEFTMNGSVGIQNLTVVRMMRVLRITRAIRVVRLIRFFRELRMMVFSVLRSGSSLLWSLLMLSVTIYIFSVYFIQIVAFDTHAWEFAPTDEAAVKSRKLREEMFGSLVSGMYTLYQVISGGISWGEVGAVLIDIDPVHAFILCFFTFFTTFALMNIITGIFVDTSINSAQNDKDEMILEQMHKTSLAVKEISRVFQAVAGDETGAITLKAFEKHLNNKEVRAHLNSIGIEIDKAKGLFRLLDMDSSGEITVEEFVFGCQRLKGNAKSIDLATLMLESQRMADQQRRFFAWSEQQFERVLAKQDSLEAVGWRLEQAGKPGGTRSL